MPASLSKHLEQSIADARLVRLKRRVEDFPLRGYVLATGSDHVLVAVVSDRIRYDGFTCLRRVDLKSVKDDPYADFAEEALRRRGAQRPPTPALSLESTRTILESASILFPLVTIHREKADPDVCHIGKVVATNRSRVKLLEIDPHAHWHETATSIALKGITRIDFGGDYEDALSLVGGAAVA